MKEFEDKIKELIYSKSEENILLAIELAKGMGVDITPSRCAIDKFKDDVGGLYKKPPVVDTILYLLNLRSVESYFFDMALKNKFYLHDVMDLYVCNPHKISLFKDWKNVDYIGIVNNHIYDDIIEMYNTKYLYMRNCCASTMNVINFANLNNLRGLEIIDMYDLNSLNFTHLGHIRKLRITIDKFAGFHHSVSHLDRLELLTIRSKNKISENTIQKIKKHLPDNCTFMVGGRSDFIGGHRNKLHLV